MKFSKFARPAWLVLQDTTTILFRALGLHAFVSAFRYLRHLTVGKGFNEPTKIAIRSSRTIALMRALIHIVPIGVAIWEIVINWNTYFLGPVVRNQAYYQFGAKIHEMTAQASLAAIVFSYIRYEMLLGQGLPFGALFSALQLSQASYLWSMEFWGSICSRHLPVRRRIGMVLIVTAAIILAATVGPSSAILLIPRLEYWPAGATNIWLNTTSQDLWPSQTNASAVSQDCLVSNPLLIETDCPSSSWQAIESYLSLTNGLLPLSFQLEYNATPAPEFIPIAGAHSLRNLYIAHEVPYSFELGYDPVTVVATTPQVAVANALSSTGLLWNLARSDMRTKGHGSVLDELDAVHSIITGYLQPYTIASCEHDTIFGEGDQNALAFPSPAGVDPQMLNTSSFNDSILSTHAFVYPGITKSQLLNTPGSPSEYRLRWVELPKDPFNGTAIGAVVLLPRSGKNTTQGLLMCSLGAGWGTSRLNTSTQAGGAQTVLSQVGHKFVDFLGRYPGGNSTVRTSPVTEEAVAANQLSFYPPLFPENLITVTEDWAQYLNPTLSGSNSTVFHRLMTSHLLRPDIATSARIILAGLLTNGLAEISPTSRLQGTLRTAMQPDGSEGLDGNNWFSGKGDAFIVDPVQSNNWVKLRVYTTFEGFAYNTRGATPKVAICFLLTYCVFALLHILYAGITGISSTCWDSISEVTALAVNSTPSTLLRNTCAGITELSIFKIPVRVLAVRDDEGGDGEHLELVFGELDEKAIQHQVIKQNRVYGTMPLLAGRKEKKA